MSAPMTTRVCLTSALLLAVGSTSAETIDTTTIKSNKSFQSFATSSDMLGHAATIARKFDEKFDLAKGCAAKSYTVKPVSLEVLKPLTYSEGKGVTDGAWKLGYEASRCNETKLYNVIFVGQPKGEPLVVPYFPGFSMADYALVKDAMRSVMMGATVLVKDKSCQDYSIFDMAVSKLPDVKTSHLQPTSWEETWTVQVCAQRVHVPIKFVPSKTGKGTEFAVSVKPIKR